MEIKGLTFTLFTRACPEQYDVTDTNGNLVGYVRLRWGVLRCDCPKWGEETIYEYDFHEDYKGCFDSDEERNTYLGLIADEVLKRMNALKKEE